MIFALYQTYKHPSTTFYSLKNSSFLHYAKTKTQYTQHKHAIDHNIAVTPLLVVALYFKNLGILTVYLKGPGVIYHTHEKAARLKI